MGLPLHGQTMASNTDVETFLNNFSDTGRYRMPDYQREGNQWTLSKKSLLIESVINNLPIPSIILCGKTENREIGEVEYFEIVDGQQRITTINDFVENRFELVNAESLGHEYMGALRGTAGRTFSKLGEHLQERVKQYQLSLITLPGGVGESRQLQLEVFRRINQGGTPLKDHDLRLATYSNSKAVYAIRLAGVYDYERPDFQNMILAGYNRDMQIEWADPYRNSWESWWREDLESAKGQTPSEMFLYYLVARDLDNANNLANTNQENERVYNIEFDGTLTSLLDIYCAKLTMDPQNNTGPALLSYGQICEEFIKFQKIFYYVYRNVSEIRQDQIRKIAFIMAGIARYCNVEMERVTNDQWGLLSVALTEGPTVINARFPGVNFNNFSRRWDNNRRIIRSCGEICQRVFV